MPKLAFPEFSWRFIFYNFFKRIRLHLYTFPSKLRLRNYTFPWYQQLYFIPVFIYTFIKVKSKWGKKRDGCAMENGYRHFFLLAAKLLRAQGQRLSKTLHQPTQDDSQQPRKYPQTLTRFYSPFWRNKPRHALSLQTESVWAPKGCFYLFPSVRRESMKKNVKSSIFRKKNK